MKFIHAADIHLDSPLRGLRRYPGAPVDELRGATRQALGRMVDLCLAERVDFLLLAGDLYDGDWDDYQTGLFFVRQMGRLREAGVPVFLIRGNHDAESRITRELRLPSNVRLFGASEAGTEHLADLGVAVHGQSFATPAVTGNLAQAYPAAERGLFNIGLLHTSAGGRPGHENYAPCSREDLRAPGYDYWALGHVHEREVIVDDATCIVFPGNLQGRQVREAGSKGCTLVESGSGPLRLEHRPLEVVRWARCAVEAQPHETSDDLLEAIRAALARESALAGEALLAVRLTVSGNTAAHEALQNQPDKFTEEVRARANDLGRIWIEGVEVQTRTPVDLEAMAGEGGPLGQMLRRLRALPGDEAELAALAEELRGLKSKLPRELAVRILPDELAAARAVAGELKQILLPRLLEHLPGA